MVEFQYLNTIKVHSSLVSPSCPCLVASSKSGSGTQATSISWLCHLEHIVFKVLQERRRTGRLHEMFVKAKKRFISLLTHPLARTLSHGPKLPLREDRKDSRPGGECSVIRMLHCLCHLSTRFSEGDASILRGKEDTVSISTVPEKRK